VFSIIYINHNGSVKNTYNFYIKTIDQYEGFNIKRNDNQYFINGVKVEDYIFKNDYIFVLGDNRDDSLDSRFKGFIPHYLIVGRVNIVF
jgi:signal peptidase I